MNISVETAAANWYKLELDIQEPESIRFFVRYGFGGRIPGFSLGVQKGMPEDVHASTEVESITFYIETSDAWFFFDDYDLMITWNEKIQEPEYEYE